MPWSLAQHRLFEGIKHGSIQPKKGLTRAKAAMMADEGIKAPAGGILKSKKSKKK